jgi:hypothetical protein
MRDPVRRILLLAFIPLVLLTGCGGSDDLLGGGGSSSSSSSSSNSIANTPAANAVQMVVDTGPQGASGEFNIPYVSITICAPGSTTNCQTIPNVEVDTGSYGVRIISSVINSTLLSALTQETVSNGSTSGILVECTMFGDGYSWGSLRQADVEVASETASSQQIQIIGDEDSLNNVPGTCSGTGPQEDTVAEFGANGIIGVGPFVQDCGTECTSSTEPGFYWICPANATGSNACTATEVALDTQSANPVYSFTTDNNGVILELPAIADAGSSTVTGALVFGIGTESNNALGSATVLTTDDQGYITVNFNSTNYIDSFIDSGSNLFYFNDSGITQCTIDSQSFFCPSSELSLSASNEGANNVTSTVSFKVANANTQFSANPSFSAFDNVAAPNSDANGFDLGLPFFYGRNVYTAIQGQNTSGGTGPYFAY